MENEITFASCSIVIDVKIYQTQRPPTALLKTIADTVQFHYVTAPVMAWAYRYINALGPVLLHAEIFAFYGFEGRTGKKCMDGSRSFQPPPGTLLCRNKENICSIGFEAERRASAKQLWNLHIVLSPLNCRSTFHYTI